MSDKKQAAAELAQQYQRLLKLEAQFPMLRKIFATAEDAAIFEPIRLKIEAQIAKQQAAKTETATAAPPPEPSEDINQDEFEAAIDNWAIKHQTAFRNIISAEKIQVQFLKDKLADVAKNSNYKVILGLIESMTNVLSEDTMPLDKIIAGFNKCIDDVALKTGKELKELYKEGKKGRKGEKDEKGTKGYQDASEADFKTALDNIDPSKWLAEEVVKSDKNIDADNMFITNMGIIMVNFNDSLDSQIASDTGFYDRDATLKNWDICLTADKCRIFAALRNELAGYEDKIPVRKVLTSIESWVSRYMSSEEHFIALSKKCPGDKSYITTYAQTHLGEALAISIISSNDSLEKIIIAWAEKEKATVPQNLPKGTMIDLKATRTNIAASAAFLAEYQVHDWVAKYWLSSLNQEGLLKAEELEKHLIDALTAVCKPENLSLIIPRIKLQNNELVLPRIAELTKCMVVVDLSYDKYKAIFTNWQSKHAADIFSKCTAESFGKYRASKINDLFYNKTIDGFSFTAFIAEAWENNLVSQKDTIPKYSINELWAATLNSSLSDKTLRENFDYMVAYAQSREGQVSLNNYFDFIEKNLPTEAQLKYQAQSSAAVLTGFAVGDRSRRGKAGTIDIEFKVKIDGPNVKGLLLNSSLSLLMVYDSLLAVPGVQNGLGGHTVSIHTPNNQMSFSGIVASSPASQNHLNKMQRGYTQDIQIFFKVNTPATTITVKKEADNDVVQIGGGEIIKTVGGAVFGAGVGSLWANPLVAAFLITSGLGITFLGAIVPTFSSNNGIETYTFPATTQEIEVNFALKQLESVQFSGTYNTSILYKNASVNGKHVSGIDLYLFGVNAE
jgi:hypothetical protein